NLAIEEREKFKEFFQKSKEHTLSLQKNVETLVNLLDKAKEELEDSKKEKEIISNELYQAKIALKDIYNHIHKNS
ncbi:MAG: hypothetical protein HQK51_12180, partial [Oligoflexia bacterium]|nr:hypothetical protein [Oligoflexia bacterium]